MPVHHASVGDGALIGSVSITRCGRLSGRVSDPGVSIFLEGFKRVLGDLAGSKSLHRSFFGLVLEQLRIYTLLGRPLCAEVI